MRYLVDSDWVVDYLKGRPEAVKLLNSLVLDGLVVSIVTYAEVLEGVYYGRDPANYEAIFHRFLRATRVLGITKPIAQLLARVSELTKHGVERMPLRTGGDGSRQR